jgi:hypothetical protein
MGELTGQTPPAMMRSKDSASGIPCDMPLLPDRTESWMDFSLTSPKTDDVEEGRDTWAGRRYVMG